MKKSFLIFALLVWISLVITSCGGGAGETTTGASSPTDASAPDTTIAPETTSVPETVTVARETTTTPATEETTTLEEPVVVTPTLPKSLKILAIGNSFSVDAMQYLYGIAKSAGVQEVILGNLYIGGCSLDMHHKHAIDNDAAYTYWKNSTGQWISHANTTFMEGLLDEEWDVITLQQASKFSGVATSYMPLTPLISIIESKMTNPDAKLYWHMTWAYQQDSTHASFPTYGKNQMKMYTMIVDAVKDRVLPLGEIDGVIPSGTSVQNARTSFVGDNLTRDGHHLSYTLGRYIAGLTYFASVTGLSLDNVFYIPSNDITPEVMAMAKSSVMDAMKKPYEVTPSTHAKGSLTPTDNASKTTVVNYDDCFATDKSIAAMVGVNLDNYVLLEYPYIANAYYCCTKGKTVIHPASNAGTYEQHICTAKIYSKDEIPVNSVIICDTGWQFRPELWISLDKKASKRPATTTELVTLMSAEWWGENKYFAFNISSSPKTNISEYYDAAASHVRIYIPKETAK